MGICLGRFIQNLFLKSRYQSRNKLLKPVFAQFNTLGLPHIMKTAAKLRIYSERKNFHILRELCEGVALEFAGPKCSISPTTSTLTALCPN